MKVRPMLGEFELDGLEYVESAESRALVEHEVPGLAGSYFQDLGSVPNTVVIGGSKHGDDPRDAFLEGIRELFNRGEPTTFVADINTGTDLTEVVIEDLDVVEVADPTRSFRYRIRLRKYVEPPEPVTPGLLDSDILDEALSLTDAFDLIDQLGSVPDLGDPTPPVSDALDGVESATGGLDDAVSDLEGLFDPDAAAAHAEEAAAADAEAGVPGAAETAPAEGARLPSPDEVELNPDDPRVDPGTQDTLRQVLADPDPAKSGQAAGLVQGINDGELAGLRGDDSPEARELAAALGLEPEALVPEGEDAALVLDPVEPLDALPTVVVRDAVRVEPARFATALERVGRTFQLFQAGGVGLCSSSSAPLALPNLVPSIFCQLGSGPPVVTAPPLITYMRMDRYVFAQSAVQSHHRDGIERLAHFIIDSIHSDPQLDILLVGHTDSVGREDFNESLGRQRATNVRTALLAQIEQLSPGFTAANGLQVRVDTRGERDPIESNATTDGRARNRRVEVILEGTCQAFFSQIDLRFFPVTGIFGVDGNPNFTPQQRADRRRDVNEIVDILRVRGRERRCLALQGQVRPPESVSLAARPAAERLSDGQEEMYEEYFPDGSGGIDFVRFQRCFEEFANGELRNPQPPPLRDGSPRQDGIGEPDSAGFFFFAEFALLCIESGIDATLWREALRPFVKAQEIFMHIYRPAPVGAPPAVGAPLPPFRPDGSRERPLSAYDSTNFNAAGQSNDARKRALRDKYRALDTDALRREMRDNLRRAQLMGPPDTTPTPDNGCPGGAPGPGGPVIDPDDPDLQIDPSNDRVDPGARQSLRRMLRQEDDQEMRVDAARLIRGINEETLAGIFGDDGARAVAIARSHETHRLELVPDGEDAVLVLDADDPFEEPPTVIFRGDTPNIRDIPERIDPALQKASKEFDAWSKTELARCETPEPPEVVVALTEAVTPDEPLVFPPGICRAPTLHERCLDRFARRPDDTTPARDLTRAAARDIVVQLVARGLITLHPVTTPLQFDQQCNVVTPRPDTRIGLRPATIDGVAFFHSPRVQQSFLANLDVRLVVMLARLCRMLRTRWGVERVIFTGLGGGQTPTDNHGSGRGFDFFGVEGDLQSSRAGISTGAYSVRVLTHWGGQTVEFPSGREAPEWPNRNSDGTPFRDTRYRLDPQQNQFANTTDRTIVLAREIFKDVYDFAAAQCTDTNDQRNGNGPPTSIGSSSVFIIHPDHPTPSLRGSHQDHIHMQIGPTQREQNPP